MNGAGYVFIWIVLLFIPAVAAYRRKWWPFSLYVVGCLIFLNAVLKGKDRWDDLADFAMLIVVIIPIYILATIVWVVGYIINRKKHSEDIGKDVT